MVNNLGGTYTTGTLSIAANGTVFTGSGTLWSVIAEQGDWILANGNIAVVTEAITDTSLTSELPWTGGALSGAAYVLLKMSWLRYEPAILQQKVRVLVADLTATGIFQFVSGTTPDPGMGVEGQWALKVNDGSWTLWYYTAGAWVLQGIPIGVNLKGDYNSGTTYIVGDTVSWQGRLWTSKVNPNLNHQPDTSPTQWRLTLSGGDQYDIQLFDTDQPASGELVNKLYPVGVTFNSGLSTSYATAEIASTGTVFYSLKKNGVEFGRLTFSPGNAVGVFTCATAITFGSGDALTIVAPAVRDLTLSGVGGNLIGYR
jgi:hypothetical protein